MFRKLCWLAAAACLAVLVFFVQSWVLDRQSESEAVAWSPLYDSRVTEALVPVTAQAAYAQASLAGPCWTWDCVSIECVETTDCKTADCKTADCEPTLEKTCEGRRTCEGYGGTGATVDCATCDGHPDCDTTGTMAGAVCTLDGPDCDGGTWDGPKCDASSMYPWECGGPTSHATCIGEIVIVDAVFGVDYGDPKIDWEPCIPGPTYDGPTCIRPTCDGPTCEGDTCEAEDCEAWDFGDAPDFPDSPYHYETSLDNDGARHRFYGIYYLGDGVDPEMDGHPSALATGDDNPEWTTRDDEDGIWFVTTLIPGEPAIAIVHASRSGSLRGWIDYDEDGTWDLVGEDVFGEAVQLAPGFNWITFVVPEGAVPDVSFARFRFGAGAPSVPHGEAENGEVEDYRVPICARYGAWVMTDDVFYRAGDDVKIRFYLGETSQVTLVRHFSDGSTEHLWAGTLEAGRHEHPEAPRRLLVDPVAETTTVEMIATSLQSGCTSWLNTPYRVIAP